MTIKLLSTCLIAFSLFIHAYAEEMDEHVILKGDVKEYTDNGKEKVIGEWSYSFLNLDAKSKVSLINQNYGKIYFEDDAWAIGVHESAALQGHSKSDIIFYNLKTLQITSIARVPNCIREIGRIPNTDIFYVLTKTATQWKYDDSPLNLIFINPKLSQLERIQLAENAANIAHEACTIMPGKSGLNIKLNTEYYDQYSKLSFQNPLFKKISIKYEKGAENYPCAEPITGVSNELNNSVIENLQKKSLSYLDLNNKYIDVKNFHCRDQILNEIDLVNFSNNKKQIILSRTLSDGFLQTINLVTFTNAIRQIPKSVTSLGYFDSGNIWMATQNSIYLNNKEIKIPENSRLSVNKNKVYLSENCSPDADLGTAGLNVIDWKEISQDGIIQKKSLGPDILKKINRQLDDFSVLPEKNILVVNHRPRYCIDNDGTIFSNNESGEGGDNRFSIFNLDNADTLIDCIKTTTYRYPSSLETSFFGSSDGWKAFSAISGFFGNFNRTYSLFLIDNTIKNPRTIASGLSSAPYILNCQKLKSGDINVLFYDSGKTHLLTFSQSLNKLISQKQWQSPTASGGPHFLAESNLLFVPRFYGYDAFKLEDSGGPKLGFSLHLGATGSYAVVLPNGVYAGSPGCEDLINLPAGEGMVDSSAVLPWRNRPAEVLEAMGGDPEQIAILSKVTERWLKKLGNPDLQPEPTAADIPTLSLINDVPLWAKGEQINLQFATKPGTAPVKDVVVRVNGVDQQRGANSTDGESEIERTIKLAEGQNWIEAVAIDAKGRNSNLLRFRTILIEAPLPAKRFIVAMGVSKYRDSSMNLEFAAKDATDLSNAIKASTNGPTEVLLLTNDQVTRDSLEKIRAFLANATENDEVVAFCAGHGVLDSNLDYVYASHEFDSGNPTATGIKLDDLVDAIGSSKSLKRLLLLDTCHAGQVGEKEEMLLAQMDTDLPKGVRAVKQRGMSVKPVSGLSAEGQQRFIEEMFLLPGLHRGINIIGASGGAEFALESALWNNGVFTATIIEALRDKKADLNSDTRISVGELRDYLGQRVSELTKGAQKPSVVASERDQDFDLIRVATTGRKTPSITEEESQLPPETDQAAQSTEVIIRDYYRAVVSRDEVAVQSFFAETVNYLSYGNQSKAKVLADHRGDWKRYSGSQFEVSNFVSTGPSSCQFILDYSLMQGERPRRGKLQMTATFTDSVPQKITSLQAKVISAK